MESAKIIEQSLTRDLSLCGERGRLTCVLARQVGRRLSNIGVANGRNPTLQRQDLITCSRLRIANTLLGVPVNSLLLVQPVRNFLHRLKRSRYPRDIVVSKRI